MNDYVQIGQHIVPTSGSYTVAMYARQSAPQSGIVELISQGESFGPGFYVGHDASGIIRASDMWLFTGVPFGAIGVMHHYALTVDATAGESKLYFDGTLAATLGAAIATTTSGSNTRFGRQFDPFGEFFGGVLDDIRIYDHALSAAEVAGLSAIPEASPVLLVGAISAIAVVWRWFSRRGKVGPN
jgi:hypothetical protein